MEESCLRANTTLTHTHVHMHMHKRTHTDARLDMSICTYTKDMPGVNSETRHTLAN